MQLRTGGPPAGLLPVRLRFSYSSHVPGPSRVDVQNNKTIIQKTNMNMIKTKRNRKHHLAQGKCNREDVRWWKVSRAGVWQQQHPAPAPFINTHSPESKKLTKLISVSKEYVATDVCWSLPHPPREENPLPTPGRTTPARSHPLPPGEGNKDRTWKLLTFILNCLIKNAKQVIRESLGPLEE